MSPVSSSSSSVWKQKWQAVVPTSTSGSSSSDPLWVSNRIITWNTHEVVAVSNFLTTPDIRTLNDQLLRLEHNSHHTVSVSSRSTGYSRSRTDSGSSPASSSSQQYWEGFDGPRRFVRSYQFASSSHSSSSSISSTIPAVLWEWKQRLYDRTGCMATHIKIEEYIPLVRKYSDHQNHEDTTTWKYDPTLMCTFPYHNNTNGEDDSSYFIAEIPIPTTTEHLSVEDDDKNDDALPPLVQHWNQPQRQRPPPPNDNGVTPSPPPPQLPAAMRWTLESEHHMTYVHVPYQTLLLRQSDMCTQWRNSRYMYAMSHRDSNNNNNHPLSPIRVVQFFNFDTTKPNIPQDPTSFQNNGTDTFGYVPTSIEEMTERARRQQYHHLDHRTNPKTPPLLPLSDLVTILITTSPIKSHPSTAVIEQAMATFLVGGGPAFAHDCRKIIVCDGYRTITDNDDDNDGDESNDDDSDNGDKNENGNQMDSEGNQITKKKENRVSRKHGNDKQAMRNGIVTEQQAENYNQYKQKLHQLCRDATATSVFQNTQMVELSSRHGYGFAVRHVLRNTDHVTTPYVCVIQHDRTFMRPTPIQETLQAMWEHGNIKYVGFSMRSNLMYRDIYIAKYGTTKEYDDMILYLPQLQVSPTQYGPNSASTNNFLVLHERLKPNIVALTETYKGSAQAHIEQKVTSFTGEDHDQASSSNGTRHQMSLVPTLYWYDNVHICDTKHYRDFIFHPTYKMVAKGGFIEDKLSPILKRTVERLGLRDGHSRFGCYLLDDHSGMFFTGHIDGGSYLSPEERNALRISKQQERERKSNK